MKSLHHICEIVSDKISVNELNNANLASTYISTENMLPNKGGVVAPSSVPTTGKVTVYKTDDVLVSNIRPYFKKIWFATNDGGCSNDVLVFRAKKDIFPEYLHYVLADDSFFDYAMKTSKGTKMPRGDKKALMEYEIVKMDYSSQCQAATILKRIDDLIKTNTKINENLELQAQVLFVEMFGEHIDCIDKSIRLGELVTTIDNRGKTPPLDSRQTRYPIIDVKALSGCSRIINYNNCTKYVSEETYNNWFRSGHPQQFDILLSTVGSLAEMKLFLGDIGCIAQNVVGFRCKEISPLYLYQYLSYIKNDLVAYNIGSVQPSIKVTHIIKHLIYVPAQVELEKFDRIVKPITLQIYNNCLENERLAAIRDTLLPKLMNGKIDVSQVQL